MFKKIILSAVFVLGSTAMFAQTQELPTTSIKRKATINAPSKSSIPQG